MKNLRRFQLIIYANKETPHLILFDSFIPDLETGKTVVSSPIQMQHGAKNIETKL